MKQQNVIFLHGIACHSMVMNQLERTFKKNGYNTLNIDYPSRKLCLEGCAEHIEPKISDFLKNNPHPTNFVTYSMGGLVLRTFVKMFEPDFLKRTVMIAPPNKGSDMANFFKDWALYKSFFGPAGQQLITQQWGVKDLMAEKLPGDVAVITGNKSIDPFSWLIMADKEHDGKVPVNSTYLQGMKEHMVVPVDHLFLTFHKTVRNQALHFVEHGNFDT